MINLGGCYERCCQYVVFRVCFGGGGDFRVVAALRRDAEADRHGKEQANTTVGIVDRRSLTREGLVKLLESTGRFGVLAVARPADC